MADSEPPGEDDDALVRGMKRGSQDALGSTLKKYAHRVKGYLRRRFGERLREPEIDAALNLAACNLWRTIATYDPAESTLLAWFIRIAHNTAVDEWRSQRRHPTGELAVEPEFRPGRASERADGGTETARERRFRLMLHVITNDLKGNMRAVAIADLMADGGADRKELAAQLGIPITQVDVTRSQMRKRVRELVLRLEREANARAGKP